jgi:protein dithiol oxidoreductase (disulfide-forming)
MTLFNRREVLALGTALALTMNSAHSAEKWIEGRHYFKIDKPQPAPRAGTVTVTEIFSYGCSACNAFHPFMQALEQKLGANATVEYLHASWLPAENWHTLQRAHIAAVTLGIARKTHDAMFAAVWQTGELAIVDAKTGRLKSRLPSIQDVARFYERVAAVPAATFLETCKSFSVDSGIRRTDALITALRADSTPTLIINGKYRLEPRSAGSAQQAVDLALLLRDK